MDSNGTTLPSATSTSHATALQPLLDIESAAAFLNVGPRFIRRLIAQRRINYLKIGKFIRFEQSELEAWIQEQRVDAVRSFEKPRRSGSA